MDFLSLGFKHISLTFICFACKDSEALHGRQGVRRFVSIDAAARRRLAMLAAAEELRDLASPPINRLETLTGYRKGQHSIRINDQFRNCFIWTGDGPTFVEIVNWY